MRLSDFDYALPKELIAQYPLKDRDSARLLVLRRKDGAIEHRIFKDIAGYFQKGDLLVLNNTKVLPGRLFGSRATGGRVEILLLEQKRGLAFSALIRPNRLKLQEKIIFNGGKTYGQLTAKNEITFSAASAQEIYDLGLMPLPPYIKRAPEDLDNTYYQTVYASVNGSIASPTAGLHFTEELISQIKDSAVNIGYITLHISYSTFKPVRAGDITEHKMDNEYFSVSKETEEGLFNARLNKRRIFAVGTTACRALEAFALGVKEGHTDLFIYPGHKFKMVDCLITNFHLPRTTLFMLVCAFAGEKLVKRAYQEAIDKGYRFYSYGDAMLII